MIRSVEFDLVTKIEPNARFASRAGAMAKAARVKEQRAAVRRVLVQYFGAHVPLATILRGNVLAPNAIEVRLTRIAPGHTADAWENLRAALKAVKDEVAAWIGVDDREGGIVTWLEPRQEKAEPHVYRVRIEVEDLAPGEPKRVVMAETASAGREAAARVKRQVTAATKRGLAVSGERSKGPVLSSNGVLSYRPEEGARAASSGARARAEAAFAKVAPALSKSEVDAYEGEMRACGMRRGRDYDRVGDVQTTVEIGGELRGKGLKKPTAIDLRDAAERALVRAPLHATREEAQAECDRANGLGAVAVIDFAGAQRAKAILREMRRDPGDEAPARDLADCETCGAKVPAPCKLDVGGRVVFGVHVARARAAGLHVPADDRGMVRPARKCHGMSEMSRHVGNVTAARRVATVPGQARLVARPCFLVLPWEQPACETCGDWGDLATSYGRDVRDPCGHCHGRGYRAKKLAREPRLEDLCAEREEVDVRVPLAHRAAWGEHVTLRRTERTIPAHGVCWVYTAATTPQKDR